MFGKYVEVGKLYGRNLGMVQLEGGQRAVRKGDGSSKCTLGKSEI